MHSAARLCRTSDHSYVPAIDFKWGFPKIRGTLLGGLYNKDYSMLGSLLGSLYFGKLPNPTTFAWGNVKAFATPFLCWTRIARASFPAQGLGFRAFPAQGLGISSP